MVSDTTPTNSKTVPPAPPLTSPGDDAAVTSRNRALEAIEAGDGPGAEAAIDELVATAMLHGRADADAWVHLLRARVAHLRHDAEDAGRLATRACAAFLAIGPTPAAAAGLASLARVLDELRRSDEAIEALAIAALIVDQLTASSSTLVEACQELASVFGELEVFDAAHRYAERAYVVTLSMADDAAVIDCCTSLAAMSTRFGEVLARAGDPGADAFFERGEQTARHGLDLVVRYTGRSDQERALRLASGAALLGLGRPDDARTTFEAVLAGSDRDGDPGARAGALTGLGRAHAAGGDHIRALEELSAGLRAWEAMGDDEGIRAALLALANSQATVGRTNAAFASLRRVFATDQTRQGLQRRRFGEVIQDRLRVVTDDRVIVRRPHMATTDPVTGLPDRHHIEQVIEELGKRWAGHEVSLVVLDIDNLPDVRHRYGSNASEEVLRHLGSLLRDRQRNDDVVARWSDDCFLVLLPRCPESAANQVADRLRVAVALAPWSDVAFGLVVSVTTGTSSAMAPFDLGALVMDAGTGVAMARAMRR